MKNIKEFEDAQKRCLDDGCTIINPYYSFGFEIDKNGELGDITFSIDVKQLKEHGWDDKTRVEKLECLQECVDDIDFNYVLDYEGRSLNDR